MRPPTTVGRDDLSSTQRELLVDVCEDPGVFTAQSWAETRGWPLDAARREVGRLRRLGLLWGSFDVVPIGEPDYRRWPVDDSLARAVLMALADGLYTVDEIHQALGGDDAIGRRTVSEAVERLTLPPAAGMAPAVYPRRRLVPTEAGRAFRKSRECCSRGRQSARSA